MVLVSYDSDSEGSDSGTTAKAAPPAAQPVGKSSTTTTTTNFSIDKTNPTRIRVNLTEPTALPANDGQPDGEPAAKRPRVGAGAFSGFNSLLPPPKNANAKPNASGPTAGTSSKPAARKIFSLKTGAEPAFSREADNELKELFAEDTPRNGTDSSTDGIPNTIPKPPFLTAETFQPPKATTGKAFMFKPLSVLRTNKKKPTKKTVDELRKPNAASPQSLLIENSTPPTPTTKTPSDPPKKDKISLFSSGKPELPPDIEPTDEDRLQDDEEEEDEILELLDDDPPPTQPSPFQPPPHQPQAESLSSLATTLNLSAAERRRLLGKHHSSSSSSTSAAAAAAKIIPFSVDEQYATNQAHIAAGEQIQHNPVRAIAPGKHSLKQLISSAQTQKDALEESFASGKRNKREAGSKYGW